MRSLQAPIVCPSVRPRQLGVSASLVNCSVSRTRSLRNQFWGNQTRNVKSQVATVNLRRRSKSIQCLFSSHSDGTGSTAENFNENDEDYVKSSVLEAGNFGELYHELSLFFFVYVDSDHRCVLGVFVYKLR